MLRGNEPERESGNVADDPVYKCSVNCPRNTAVFAAVRRQFGRESQLAVVARPQPQLDKPAIRRLEHGAALQRLQPVP